MKVVVKKEQVYRRRRATVAGAMALAVLLLVLGVRGIASGRPATSVLTPGTPAARVAVPPATHLVERVRVTGEITPRGLAASSTGTVLAANMMYRHTVTAYDAAGSLVATIGDSVDLATFGIEGHEGHEGPVRGAPVEVAFTPDGTRAYVANYSMSGPGFGPEPSDTCTTNPQAQGSYLYRIDVRTHRIDQVVAVGAVPRDLAVSPDGRTAVVSNWCSGDLSLVDLGTARETARIAVGDHPRGSSMSADGRTAYVLVGSGGQASTLRAVDLGNRAPTNLATVGADARRTAVLPDGSVLVTSTGDSTLRRIDARSGAERARIPVPAGPRTLALGPDGAVVYLVSYDARMLTALDARTLAVRSQVRTPEAPTGVVFEPTRKAVWVAGYTGSIAIYDEAPGTATPAATAGTPASATTPGSPTTSAPPTTPVPAPASTSGALTLPAPEPTGSASIPEDPTTPAT